MTSLQGRRALVTGGHKRLGRAIALHLAELGADVAIHHRSDRPLAEAVAAEIERKGRRSLVLSAELTDSAALGRLLDQIAAAWGGLDLLVASAASYVRTPADRLDAAQIDRILQENARAPVDLVLQARRLLEASPDGRVVVLGDHAGLTPFAGYLAHSMAKAALHAGIRGLAAELGPALLVNGVVPGAVLRPDDLPQDAWDRLQARVPMGQAAQDPTVPVQAVADAVAYLATCARYVSGHLLVVDGGRTARW